MKRNYLKIVFCILSPVLVIGFVLLNGYPATGEVFMNGRVADKHSYIEHKCLKCHIPWKGVNNGSCTECHVDDKHYMRNELDETIADKLKCFDCHQEHRGKSYDLEVAEYLQPKC